MDVVSGLACFQSSLEVGDVPLVPLVPFTPATPFDACTMFGTTVHAQLNLCDRSPKAVDVVSAR